MAALCSKKTLLFVKGDLTNSYQKVVTTSLFLFTEQSRCRPLVAMSLNPICRMAGGKDSLSYLSQVD